MLPSRPAAEGLREKLLPLVLDSVSSEHSRRAYGRALTEFFGWYEAAPRGPFSRAVLQAYRSHLESRGLAASSINVALAACRKLAAEAADAGLLDAGTAAAIGRVKGVRQAGVRGGNWLTREQVRTLLSAPDLTTVAGLRDRAILAMLIGCGLRRAELVALRVEAIAQREGRWVIPDLVGKGGRVRTVPVPAWSKAALDAWTQRAGITVGALFRSTRKGNQAGEALTERMIWHIVQKYARQIGVGALAPHDLRRTCAKLCRSAGGELEQIQFLLGHASVQTTERYLGSRQNLREAVNDRMGIE